MTPQCRYISQRIVPGIRSFRSANETNPLRRLVFSRSMNRCGERVVFLCRIPDIKVRQADSSKCLRLVGLSTVLKLNANFH